MIYTKAAYVLLINVIILQFCGESKAYTQISSRADQGEDHNNDGPKIYKAVNFDLIFPKR